MKLLKHMRHENIVRIEKLLPSPKPDLADLYIAFSLMDTDLHQIIQSKQQLSEEHCRYFLYQVSEILALYAPAAKLVIFH